MKQRCARAGSIDINEKPGEQSVSQARLAPPCARPCRNRFVTRPTIVIVSVLDATGNACALRYCNR